MESWGHLRHMRLTSIIDADCKLLLLELHIILLRNSINKLTNLGYIYFKALKKCCHMVVELT